MIALPRDLPSVGILTPKSQSYERRIHCGLVLVMGLGLATGCSHVQRALVFEKNIDLPPGRFTGPIEIDVPRRADHKSRDFEIETQFRSACGPLLRMSFPDGEVAALGDDDEAWQNLLLRRATAGSAAETPPGPSVPGQSGAPLPPSGHWESVRTESWPGQLAFLQQRQSRCATINTYSSTYLNAFDESGRMTFWADTPQEVANANISLKMYVIIDIEAEAEAAAEVAAAAADAAAEAAAAANARANVDVKLKASVSVSVKIPPMPKPKKETPPPAVDAGATWVPGEWQYEPGLGQWIWHRGWWARPSTTPPLKSENTGAPPTAGCTWHNGHWEWVGRSGSWQWRPGHWNAPPPRVENPGTPPVPESTWVAGYWVEVNGHFEWVAGYWGKPNPRVETQPPPPNLGATWVAGIWINIKGTWVWSPGYYERSGRPPPAPKKETAPPSPAPGAIWLSGFWRWDVSKNDYEWISGHWEVPPGEGYAWVADPPLPAIGVSVSGHWELRVKVNTKGTVEVKP